MLKVFVGDDRVKISETIAKMAEKAGLATENVAASTLKTGDLPNIFSGTTLFATKRFVVIKDFSENSEIWNALPNFLPDIQKNNDTTVIFFEKKLDKRTSAYKELKKYADITEMVSDKADEKLVFDVFGLAISGKGREAVEIIDKIKHQNEPQMFFGLITSQIVNLSALVFSGKPSGEVAKDLGVHPFAMSQLEKHRADFSKNEMRKILKRFLETDRAMKFSSPSDPWILIKQLILQISL